MFEEDKRKREWLEKFKRFVIDAEQFFIKRLSEKQAHPQMRKWRQFVTQKIRREIVRGLGELYEIALRFAKDEALDLREREKWGRLAAYIAQTINTILQTYDVMKIEKSLDELKQYVKIQFEEG